MIVKIDGVNANSLVGILEFINSPKNVLHLSNFDQKVIGSLPFPVRSVAYEPFPGSGGGERRETLPNMVSVKTIKPIDEISTFAVTLEICDRVCLSNGGYRGMEDGDKRQEARVKVPEDYLIEIYRLIKF